MKKVERRVPSDLDIHVIVDNSATQKHPDIKAWLEKNPRVTFHFLTTSSSWLNLIQRFFGELTTRQIERLAVISVNELIETITRHIERRNEAPKPFVWTASAGHILETVRKVNAISSSQH